LRNNWGIGEESKLQSAERWARPRFRSVRPSDCTTAYLETPRDDFWYH
jgi:hypothetical protein